MASSLDIGIDLGTATVIICINDQIVLKEPSVVALNTVTGEILAVGTEAFEMLGRTPSTIRAQRPLAEGVIADYNVTERMMKYFFRKVSSNMLIKPKVAICVPSSVTGVESRAVVEAAVSAGARKVYLVEEPVAAAIGAGIDIALPNGSMVVDIGGGTTDVAVLSLSGIVTKTSLKVAGDKFDEAIIKAMRQHHSMLIGERTAEQIKIEIGTAYAPDPNIRMQVKGRNLINGLPQVFYTNAAEVFDAIQEPLDQIMLAMQSVLERTPPELVGDILQNGILLTGGGAKLNGLPELILERIKAPAFLAERPDECVAIGTGRAFQFSELLHDGMTRVSAHDH